MVNTCTYGLTSHRHSSFGMHDGHSLCNRCGKVIDRNNDEVPMQGGSIMGEMIEAFRTQKTRLYAQAQAEHFKASQHLAREQNLYDCIRDVEKRIIDCRKNP